MMRWKLKELIGEYQSVTGKTIRYEDIMRETGLSTNTLSIIGTQKAKRADLDTLYAILNFFSGRLGRDLNTNDLLEFVEVSE